MTSAATLLKRRQAAIPAGAASAYPIFVERAEGSEIWDTDGRHYVDFVAGIAVMNVGHRHPKVTAAIAAQLERYAHVAFPVQAYEPYVAVCEKLNAAAPIADAVSFLVNTGAEATENAVKIARLATGRPGIIAFTGSFHGRTNLAMALTGKVAPLRANYPYFQTGIFHVPFPVPDHGVTEEDAFRALDHVFRAQASPDQIAAILVEPVQGEGGYYAAPADFLHRLAEIARAHGILFIADEIQSGFGRTGKFFAIEHAGVEPDLIPVAKALGGGLPLAGVIGKRAVMAKVAPGSLGGTFAGNPLACAAALAVFDIIAEEKLLDRASALGARLTAGLARIAARNDVPPIGAIRATGAMVAFEIFRPTDALVPDPETTKAVATAAAEEGLLVLPCGYWGNTIRIAPPLTTPDALLDEGLDRLARALARTTVHR